MKDSHRTSVTQLYREQITLPFARTPGDAGQVTRRFTAADGPAVPGTLQADELVAGRYRVLAGPLGGVTGEAEVYHCRDENLGEEVAVKLYRHRANPKESVIRQLEGLDHPHILRLISHGRWMGRFFEVTELCRGGVMSDAMPFSEAALGDFLPAILQGLDFCHRQGIVHRDLKPNNLFFRDTARTELLIGDFGISSYLDRRDEAVRETRTAANLTLDYAAPEMLDGHEVGAKTDYYALGITLLHLLAGRSPFHGMSHNDVLVAHLRGRVGIPDSLSGPFRDLLRGLTLGNPQVRWGLEQVSAWLKGDAVPLEPGRTAWSTAIRDSSPYPGHHQAGSPEELAASLDRFDALRQLARGDIRRWVFDHFDHRMADRIERLEHDATERPDLALSRLRFILDPALPLEVAGLRLNTLNDLVELLQRECDTMVRERLGGLLRDGLIEDWIRAGNQAAGRTDELLARTADLRKRFPGEQHQGVALDALLYILDPTTPIRLSGEQQVSRPRDIALAFEHGRKRIGPVLVRHLFDKRLDEWIRAAEFPGWHGHLTFLEDLRVRYLEQPLLGVHCLCWRFNPDMPLLFMGVRITRPRQLAALIDRSPENTAEGMRLMEQGWIRAWLVGSGKITDPVELDHALLAIDVGPQSKLEAVLHLLDPSLGYPQLETGPESFHFGRIIAGDTRVQELRIENTGRGHLNGEIKLDHYGAGVMLDSYKVEDNAVGIQVRVITLGMANGRYSNALHVNTNGGNQEIPIQFTVWKPVDKRTWWQKLIE